MMKLGSNPMPLANEHFIQLYRSDAELGDSVATYALDVMDYDRQAMIFFATRRHCEMFKRSLMLHEFDVGGAIARGQLSFVHVEDLLPKLVDGETVNPVAFARLVGGELERVRDGGRFRHVHVYGEIVDVLWRSGKRNATIDLEELWNQFQKTESFTLYCAYHATQNMHDLVKGEMREAIATHNAVMQESGMEGQRHRRVFIDVANLTKEKPVLASTSPARKGAAA